MSNELAIYVGPKRNKYGFKRGGRYVLTTDSEIVGPYIYINLIVMDTEGEVVCGPLQYWDDDDLTKSWRTVEDFEAFKEEYEEQFKEEDWKESIMRKPVIFDEFLNIIEEEK